MNILTRLALSATFLIGVGLLEPHEGIVALRSLSELLSGLASGIGTSADAGFQLAQLGSAFSVQRPSHEVLDLAVRAFGYPVNGDINLLLTLTGMALVGAGVMFRCRRD